MWERSVGLGCYVIYHGKIKYATIKYLFRQSGLLGREGLGNLWRGLWRGFSENPRWLTHIYEKDLRISLVCLRVDYLNFGVRWSKMGTLLSTYM